MAVKNWNIGNWPGRVQEILKVFQPSGIDQMENYLTSAMLTTTRLVSLACINQPHKFPRPDQPYPPKTIEVGVKIQGL